MVSPRTTTSRFAALVFLFTMSTTTTKTILITGSTDGIGRLASQKLLSLGHDVILHGRSADKVQAVATQLGGTHADAVVADLSDLSAVEAMAETIRSKYDKIDILINNAGVFKLPAGASATNRQGMDVRFAVNTVAPYVLTKRLIPLIPPKTGRVINVSSAAQQPVNLQALRGKKRLHDDFAAYSQSKLAVTAWTRHWAQQTADSQEKGPIMIAVNPGSLLATKMVQQGFGMKGNDVNQGADILVSLALDAQHATHNGDYFDNDQGRYGPPHPDALDPEICSQIAEALEKWM